MGLNSRNSKVISRFFPSQLLIFILLTVKKTSPYHDQVLYLKENYYSPPLQIRCPAFEKVSTIHGEVFLEALKENGEGDIFIRWRRDNTMCLKEKLTDENDFPKDLAFIDIVDGELINFKKTHSFELFRKIVKGRTVDVPLKVQRIDFEGHDCFILKCEVEFYSRTCKESTCKGTFERIFSYLVKPESLMPTSIWLPNHMDHSPIQLNLEEIDPTSLKLMIKNVELEGQNRHSIVSWEVINNFDEVRFSSEDVLEPIAVRWSQGYNVETATIRLKPKRNWINQTLCLKIYARNYFLLTPTLRLETKLDILYAPDRPRIRILQGLLDDASLDEYEMPMFHFNGQVDEGKLVFLWISIVSQLEVECSVDHLGNPPGSLSMKLPIEEKHLPASQHDDHINRASKVVRWRGSLASSLAGDSATFACQVDSNILQFPRSDEIGLYVAYGPSSVKVVGKSHYGSSELTTFKEGERTVLDCTVDGIFPNPTSVVWSVTTLDRVTSNLTDRHLGLHLVPRRQNHFQIYNCLVVNPITKVTRLSHDFTLKVEFRGGVSCDADHSHNSTMRFDVVCEVVQFPLMTVPEFKKLVLTKQNSSYSLKMIYVGVVQEAVYTNNLDFKLPQAHATASFRTTIRLNPSFFHEKNETVAFCNVCFVGTVAIVDDSEKLHPNRFYTKTFSLKRSPSPPSLPLANSSLLESLGIVAVVLVVGFFVAVLVLRFSCHKRREIEKKGPFRGSRPIEPIQYRSSLIYDLYSIGRQSRLTSDESFDPSHCVPGQESETEGGRAVVDSLPFCLSNDTLCLRENFYDDPLSEDVFPEQDPLVVGIAKKGVHKVKGPSSITSKSSSKQVKFLNHDECFDRNHVFASLPALPEIEPTKRDIQSFGFLKYENFGPQLEYFKIVSSLDDKIVVGDDMSPPPRPPKTKVSNASNIYVNLKMEDLSPKPMCHPKKPRNRDSASDVESSGVSSMSSGVSSMSSRILSTSSSSGMSSLESNTTDMSSLEMGTGELANPGPGESVETTIQPSKCVSVSSLIQSRQVLFPSDHIYEEIETSIFEMSGIDLEVKDCLEMKVPQDEKEPPTLELQEKPPLPPASSLAPSSLQLNEPVKTDGDTGEIGQ